jgi:hypothetical protein
MSSGRAAHARPTHTGTPAPPACSNSCTGSLNWTSPPDHAAAPWRPPPLADLANVDDRFTRTLELHGGSPATFDTARTGLY